MLGSSPAFSSFSVDDLARASAFYRDTLGLEVTETSMGLELRPSGALVFVYPKDDHQPATFTVLNFTVDDVRGVVERLRGAGIRFEQYDLDGMTTDEHGVFSGGGATIAWFKDPAGNVLSVVEQA